MSVQPKSITSRVLLGASAACFLFGAGATVVDVVLRATAGLNLPGAIELTSFAIGLGALLSMPVCYTTHTHVTAKLVSELSPGRFARFLGQFGALMSVVFAGMLLWILLDNTASKLGSPETSPDLGLPVSVTLGVVTLALAASFIAALIGFRSILRDRRI
jgi:TRAP-type C4-dicarboxylate transport system permease small subunit